MNNNRLSRRNTDGHGITLVVVLCLFAVMAFLSASSSQESREAGDDEERVYLIHADVLHYDQDINPDAKILNGNVEFYHKGAKLYSDSAYFYEESNSFEAFSNVRMYQGDTLSLFSDYAYYDGNEQMALARYNVILKHNETTLYTDSLNYDRLYDMGYFFEGGKMVDGVTTLIADWGEYDAKTHQSVFNYDVRLKDDKMFMTSDTLYYNTQTKLSHVLGPSNIASGTSHVYTEDGYHNSATDRSELYGRSIVRDKGRTIVADSIFHNGLDGTSEAFINVIYNDTVNKNMLLGDYCWYDDSIGYAMCTIKALAIDYSQKDSLYMHADTFKVFTFNINTDSVYRKVHAYNKVRSYRTDAQAVCDSLVYNTQDSCMTMYRDPILWNNNQQLLGEEIRMYMNDSTIERTHAIGQALSVEQLVMDTARFNEISSDEMIAYFHDGDVYMSEAIDNVLALYYMIDDSDSSYIGLNYTETSLARMFLAEKKMQKIWTPKAEGVIYPVSQIPLDKRHLANFAWFDYIRPRDKDDIYNWRGKAKSLELKPVKRREAPLQHLSGGGDGEDLILVVSDTVAADTTVMDSLKKSSIAVDSIIGGPVDYAVEMSPDTTTTDTIVIAEKVMEAIKEEFIEVKEEETKGVVEEEAVKEALREEEVKEVIKEEKDE